ncbi:CDT1-like protein a, chloroplastic [Rhodamnia argentea]|uniref:CDT1-like protein a, chloroplastic n=1 Tax=Rhodamnia argentea TaxID=178133 RepID=A0A8B8Q5T5_9MYRT|nr:CDT1-like protein a, chloroplastic [Rhodamnia argentea]
MEQSSDSASSIAFRSKKPFSSTSRKVRACDDGVAKAGDLLSSKTPEKPSCLPNRVRNRGVALSIKDVRRAAESLRESSNRDPPAGREAGSARKQIFSDEAPARKPKRSLAGLTKLPEKYEVLGQFFDGLDSSVRLLKLKGSVSTFTNIRPKIECLTDRRFTHRHLSQLKFILPEAIEIKKVLTFDEQTSCMKPNLCISLNADAIQKDGKTSLDDSKINLRKLFRARLSEFVNAHPEGDEVPEEPLPEPFNHTQDRISNEILQSKASLPAEASTEDPVGLQPVVASHLSGSFRRRFSQNVERSTSGNTSQMMSVVSLGLASLSVPEPRQDEVSNDEEADSSEPPEDELASQTSSDEHLADSAAPVVCPPSNNIATPSKVIDLLKNDDSPQKISSFESTPAKLASTPARLMAATPELQPPNRSFMSPEDDCASSPHKLVRRPPRTRSLKFDTPVKDMSAEDEARKKDSVPSDDDIYDILPQDLLQKIRDREKKAKEDKDPAISRAKRRREILAALPQLFNMMHFFFKSTKRFVITREELIYQIIKSRFDMIDRREVEEQLDLMKELVPEWISEKAGSTGDRLFSVNKMSDPDSVRQRLAETK